MAVPMDKSVGFALMSKKAYEVKMDKILNCCQFEKVIKHRKNAKDPTFSEEEKVNDCLDAL